MFDARSQVVEVDPDRLKRFAKPPEPPPDLGQPLNQSICFTGR